VKRNMKEEPKGKEALEKGQAEEKARSDESHNGPTVFDIAHMGPVKSMAVRFVSATDRMLNGDRERAIAAWAYACGMANTIKKTERALGTHGASAVFGSIAEAVPVTKCEDGHEECALCHEPWTAGEEFDKLEKLFILTGGKQASGRFDPMYM
jgi:hypothetical protein